LIALAEGNLKARGASLLGWTARACVLLGAFLVTVEMCARIDDALRFGAPFWGAYSADLLTGVADDGTRCNVPNARFEKWHNNALGFRGVEFSPAKPKGTLRVVCMGSSESYGLHESPGGEWPAQLQTLLPLPGWQVINASMVGIDLRNYQEYLAKHVVPLNPDVVILVVNPNRYANFYARDQLGSDRQGAAHGGAGERPGGGAGKLLQNIRSLPKFKLAVKGALVKSFPAYLHNYQERELEQKVREAESLRLKGKKPFSGLQPLCEANFRRDIAGLVRFLKARGIAVMLTSYPSLLDRENVKSFRLEALDYRRFGVEYSLPGIIEVRERLNNDMAALSVSEGTMFADIWASTPRDAKHFGDGVHFTDLGAHLVAVTIGKCLQENLSVTRRASGYDGAKQP
jgi:hypothetical protein